MAENIETVEKQPQQVPSMLANMSETQKMSGGFLLLVSMLEQAQAKGAFTMVEASNIHSNITVLKQWFQDTIKREWEAPKQNDNGETDQENT